MSDSNPDSFYRTAPTILVMVFFLLGASCTELKVPPVVAQGFLISPPEEGPSVSIQWTGEGLDDSEWIRSYTNYRVFFDDLENTTGSIRDLLEPGILQSIHRSEMRLAANTSATEMNRELFQKYGTGSADCTLKIEIQEKSLSYFPRREFIQTPGGIRPGHIVTYFEYSYCLNDRCKNYKIERTIRTHTDEAAARLETEAGLVLKQMQSDAYDFLSSSTECQK
ncbi:MAG: hypothetical protein RH862_17770 [Leptospiraceae bacterium]